ncbi:hypothetical protein [Agromyces sp. LHK192]|uniref:hypothetical protein n=1 Tax=Agromyces sp. LHK192 TaxID=2498704 RepID=UPI000FDB16A7|nr:hypothetical protein [Agromyces sp. LHK192]
MHAAVSIPVAPAGPSRTRPAPGLGQLVRRTGVALLAWSRRIERRRPSQEQLAWRHERRVEAERLRDEHRLQVLTRAF